MFEALTATLCERGWAAMQALERAGRRRGRRCAKGAFQRAVASGARRGSTNDAARLKALMTGVSAHPDLAEPAADVLPASPPPFAFAGDAVAAPLNPLRLAAPFERLREASDAAFRRATARGRRSL